MSITSSKLLAIALLILLFDFFLVETQAVIETQKTSEENERLPRSGTGIDCRVACAARCKASGRPNLCKRACGTCCARCSCVPPGTYGNYQACPCYARLTTKGGKRKCP